MNLWLTEKHHACHVLLLEFQIKQLKLEIKMEKGPQPWAEYRECVDILTEIRDNIARIKSDNDVFLKDTHSTEYFKSL